MRLFTKLLGLTLIAFATTQTANAATFDFAYYADNEGERGYDTYTKVEDGIEIKAKGKQWDGAAWQDAKAYLDSGNAGLGVCKVLSSTQCLPSSDDNVTPDEKLVLHFDQMVELEQVVFRNGKHGTSFAGDAEFELKIDSGAWATYSLTNLFNVALIGNKFQFANKNSGFNSDLAHKYEFYIDSMTVSAVPIPAAIWLFGSAMLGFTAMRRNNKKPA